MIQQTDYRIPCADSHYQLLLRNKCLGDSPSGDPAKTVLFVHGATYGSSDTFDYAVEGQSWMDQLASQGFDAWCLDLLGYGKSDRPQAMDADPAANAPLVDTAHAVVEVNHAVKHIFASRNISKLNLIGYSWGTAICGTYAGQYPQDVHRLVLSGALWLQGLKPTGVSPAGLGAYRTVTVESMMKRWATGLSEEEINQLISAPDRLAWCQHTASCDPHFASTGMLRAPTGVMKDYAQCRESGQDWYDPSLIRCPVFIIVGELDQETTPAQGQQLLSRLTGTASSTLTVVDQGTHSLLLERNRHQLHGAVQAFLQD